MYIQTIKMKSGAKKEDVSPYDETKLPTRRVRKAGTEDAATN